MPKEPHQQDFSLADLRRDIDRIDEAMHALLIERGEIIDRLIAVKKTQESGSAFRPAREADMMRRLVQRHHGNLPLDTVESIWRVIIATFPTCRRPSLPMPTFPPAMRRCAIPPAFISALRCRGAACGGGERRGGGDGIDRRSWPGAGVRHRGRGPMVDRVGVRHRPKDHRPAALCRTRRPPSWSPVFVISRVAADAMVTETEVWSMRVSGWSAMSVDSLAGLADAIAVPDRAFDGAALLISVARGGIDAVAEALRGTGASIRSKALVGSHASRYTVPSK